MMQYTQVKLEIFAPEEVVEPLREALHQAGCGEIGDYDHCIAISQVRGYWRPLSGATPYDGELGKISEGVEYKLEVNCKAENIQIALAAVRRVHPYEEPLINIVPLLNDLYR